MPRGTEWRRAKHGGNGAYAAGGAPIAAAGAPIAFAAAPMAVADVPMVGGDVPIASGGAPFAKKGFWLILSLHLKHLSRESNQSPVRSVLLMVGTGFSLMRTRMLSPCCSSCAHVNNKPTEDVRGERQV